VNLDAHDNDDRRFWSAVLGALGSCRVVGADDPLRALPVPAGPSRDPRFLASVVDALDALPEPVTLVLDDVHELTRAEPLHGLAVLVRDRPAGVQVVLSTRLDPPLRLSRLRVAGRLCEVRAPELAFRPDEARAMLATADVVVRPEQVAVLIEQTDGWAAGLRLAALSLHDADDVEPFLADLVGNGRAISDYLVGEILPRLAPDVVEVIRAVSICDELTAPLAVAVSGRDDAGDVLAALERETSLVTSYGPGRRWFRIHPLLRAQLRADLERSLPDRVAPLHERAARSLAAADDSVAALRHAPLVEDVDQLAGLLRGFGPQLAGSGHHAAVVAAVDALPRATVDGDARLALVAARAHLELGRLDVTDGLLERAGEAWPADPDPELAALRAAVRDRRRWYGTGSTDEGQDDAGWTDDRVADAAAGTGPAEGPGSAEPAVAAQLDRAALALTRDRLPEAERLTRVAVDRADREGHHYPRGHGTVTLAVLAGLRGDAPRMVALAERAGNGVPPDAWRGTLSESYALFLRAYGALMQARPEECLAIAAVGDGATTAARVSSGSGAPPDGIDALVPRQRPGSADARLPGPRRARRGRRARPARPRPRGAPVGRGPPRADGRRALPAGVRSGRDQPLRSRHRAPAPGAGRDRGGGRAVDPDRGQAAGVRDRAAQRPHRTGPGRPAAGRRDVPRAAARRAPRPAALRPRGARRPPGARPPPPPLGAHRARARRSRPAPDVGERVAVRLLDGVPVAARTWARNRGEEISPARDRRFRSPPAGEALW
jgi:LuxR family maltose regulon positive regulatory protein